MNHEGEKVILVDLEQEMKTFGITSDEETISRVVEIFRLIFRQLTHLLLV